MNHFPAELAPDDRAGRNRNAKISLGLFLTCLLAYGLVWSGHHYSIDGVMYFQYAKVLLFHHTFSMNPMVYWGGDIPSGRGPVGLALLYVPVLAVLAVTVFRGNNEIRQIPYNPALDYDPAVLANSSYMASSFVNPVITAFTAVVLFWVGLRLGLSVRKASAASLVFGLASPAAAYAKFDFAQPLASCLLLLAFLFILRARDHGWRSLIAAGTFLGAAILTRPELAVASAPILIIAASLIQPDRVSRRHLLSQTRVINFFALAIPTLGFILLNQYFNYLRLGSWVSVGYNPSAEFTSRWESIGTALLANWFSLGRGVFIFFPYSCLALIGIWNLARVDRLLAFTLGVSIASYTILFSAWRDWPGGLSWGPRLFVPLIPYLTLLACLGHAELARLGRGWVSGILIAVGGVITLQAVLVDFQGFYKDPWISPLWVMWQTMFDPTHFDVYWLKNAEASQGITLWILVAGLGLAAITIKLWITFFRQVDRVSLSRQTI